MSNSRKFDRPMKYQIRVHGCLEPKWSKWFDDFDLTPQENDETILEGLVADQAALHGLLDRIRNIGLPLLAVTCEESESAASSDDAAHDSDAD